MRKLIFIIMICLIFTMLSCSGDEAECPVMPAGPTVEELEARVVENCHTLEDALLLFASYNNGIYPVDIYNDTIDLGLTVIDLLPDGQLLENPFTGERTEPVDTVATEPGQTGYFLRYPWGTIYYINGFGESHTIVELSNVEELEWEVISNCWLVLVAAERFAALNGGIYPSDVGLDTTPEGYTLIDLLPGGLRLVNPFAGIRSEPTVGAAATPGNTGYVPTSMGGLDVGCVITGVGNVAGLTIFTAASSPYCSGIRIFGEMIYCSGDCCLE